MLTLSEAMAKVTDPRVKVQLMKPFTADEVDPLFLDVVNDALVSRQKLQESRRTNENPFVRASQYLHDTYGFNDDGHYAVPIDNAEDMAIYEAVKLYENTVSDIETMLIVQGNDHAGLLGDMLRFIQ